MSEQTVPVSAFSLMGEILTASAAANFRTMDRLYEGERERRQALEVLIEDVLERLDDAHMGSAREYEQAVRPLRFGVAGREEALAARHHEQEAR